MRKINPQQGVTKMTVRDSAANVVGQVFDLPWSRGRLKTCPTHWCTFTHAHLAMIIAVCQRELTATIAVAVLAAACGAENQADSLSALQKIGATVIRNDKAPGGPVIGV